MHKVYKASPIKKLLNHFVSSITSGNMTLSTDVCSYGVVPACHAHVENIGQIQKHPVKPNGIAREKS